MSFTDGELEEIIHRAKDTSFREDVLSLIQEISRLCRTINSLKRERDAYRTLLERDLFGDFVDQDEIVETLVEWEPITLFKRRIKSGGYEK
jgi:hypothetical protein